MSDIVTMINNSYAEERLKNNPWHNSPYANFLKLGIDARGRLGEEIISQAINISNNSNIIINEDITNVNAKGKGIHYDMKINNKLIEIKTAYRDKANAWQHENLYVSASDIVVFVDFDYTGIYISVIPNEKLPLGKDSEIFGRKHGTLRKNKDDGYKLDFSLTTLSTFLKYGNNYSKFFNAEQATLSNIGDFVTERILNLCGNCLKK